MKTTLRILFLILAVFCASSVTAYAENNNTVIPRITVRGQSELEVPADQFSISLSVVNKAESSKEALNENSRVMDKLVKALETTGLGKEEYRTSHFQIQPVWKPRPRNADQGWQPEIVGYTATNSILVTTRQLEKAGEIITAASKAGANQIGSLVFDLYDKRKYRSKAIEAAIANGIADAKAAAAAAGVQLQDILELQLDDTATTPVRLAAESMTFKAGIMADSRSFEAHPGDVSVRASVRIVFAIDQ